MRSLLISLTDDPFDPPGIDRYGGAHVFMFYLCRQMINRGDYVTLITRKSRPDKPTFQEMGPRLTLHRLEVGPDRELSHHDLWEWKQLLLSQMSSVLGGESFGLVFSMNWLSGLMAVETSIKPHFHHVLSLGRVRRDLGEEGHSADPVRDHGEVEVFQRATRLICACRDELLSLQNLYPEVDPSKTIIIPYPVDSNAFTRRPMDPNLFLRWKAQRLQEGA